MVCSLLPFEVGNEHGIQILFRPLAVSAHICIPASVRKSACKKAYLRACAHTHVVSVIMREPPPPLICTDFLEMFLRFNKARFVLFCKQNNFMILKKSSFCSTKIYIKASLSKKIYPREGNEKNGWQDVPVAWYISPSAHTSNKYFLPHLHLPFLPKEQIKMKCISQFLFRSLIKKEDKIPSNFFLMISIISSSSLFPRYPFHMISFP